MAIVNDKTKEVYLKVPYVGILGSGKTTSLKSVMNQTYYRKVYEDTIPSEEQDNPHFMKFLPLNQQKFPIQLLLLLGDLPLFAA